jgi:hypothetical protein
MTKAYCRHNAGKKKKMSHRKHATLPSETRRGMGKSCHRGRLDPVGRVAASATWADSHAPLTTLSAVTV